jgi:hypothetical protein
VNFTPPPPATPPPPTQPTDPGPIGLTSAEEFATVSFGYLFDAGDGSNSRPAPGAGNVEFRYSAADQSYEILIPGYNPGRLETLSYNGSACADGTICDPSSSFNAVTDGDSTSRQDVTVTLEDPDNQNYPPLALTYTSLGTWDGSLADPANPNQNARYNGTFVYGVPTAPADVPRSGTASYDAIVNGVAIFDSGTEVAQGVFGTAELNFDFGAGTLAGYMEPTITDGWDEFSLGRYDFIQTVYSVGATTFSGRFDVPGQSFFEGSFNGPQAAELMAQWNAPFVDPLQRGSGTMTGVWIGKKN